MFVRVVIRVSVADQSEFVRVGRFGGRVIDAAGVGQSERSGQAAVGRHFPQVINPDFTVEIFVLLVDFLSDGVGNITAKMILACDGHRVIQKNI